MKAFSLIKVLTVVSMILFTHAGWGADVKYSSIEDCIKRISASCDDNEALEFRNLQKSTNDKGITTETYSLSAGAAKKECVNNKKEQLCGALNLSGKDDVKQVADSCNTAYDKYSEVATKGNEACSAFEKTETGKSCKSKVDACANKINALTQPYSPDESTDPENPQSGVGALESIALQGVYQKLGLQGQGINGDGSGACVKSIDRKARAQDKKDKDRDRRDLMDKIKKEKDDIVKFKEDLDKETNTVKEKQTELEAENKKSALKKDKEMREEIAKISKNTVDVGKRLRIAATNITKKQQQLANVNFEYQTSMLELTDDKVNQKCKQEFESLKAGIVSSKVGSAPANASPEDKKNYEALAALAAQYKAKGIRGTGELKTMLLSTRKACFEGANSRRNKNKMVNAQAVKNIQDEIEELKNSMNDEKKNLSLDQENIQKIQAETDKEKSQEETEKLEKLSNLNSKMQNLITSTNAKTQASNEKIQELNSEIQKLSIVDKFEVEDAYSEAEDAIGKSELARKRALSSCSCDTKSASDPVCSVLNDPLKSYDGKKTTTKTSK